MDGAPTSRRAGPEAAYKRNKGSHITRGRRGRPWTRGRWRGGPGSPGPGVVSGGGVVRAYARAGCGDVAGG